MSRKQYFLKIAKKWDYICQKASIMFMTSSEQRKRILF